MAHEVYRMKDSPQTNIPFKLLYVTRSEYDKGWLSTPHTHHFTELFYIVKGRGSFVLPSQEVPVKENDLIIINPNIEHTEKSNEQDSMEYIALGLEGISFTLPDNDSQIGLFTYQGDREDILFFLQKLLYEAQNINKHYQVVCRNIIEILIVKLYRAKNITLQKHDSVRLNHYVALIQQYMNRNFKEPITLDTLAKVGNINKYYLSHIFKEELGISPIDYLNQVRIREAQILLESTNYSIGEIAHIIGFSSQAFFTQAFKRISNKTPSQYRKENSSNNKRRES